MEPGRLHLTGPEAARFLHNLTTQDVLNLPAGSIIHGPRETQVRLDGRMKTPADFGRIR